MEASEIVTGDKNFIDTSHTRDLHFNLALKINSLDVSKPTVERIVGAIGIASRFLPYEIKEGKFNSFLAKPDEVVQVSQDQGRSIWDVGRVLIFLSENKDQDHNSIALNAQKALISLDHEHDKSKYINYKNYLEWIVREKENDKLDVLIRGKSAKEAMLKMIGKPLELLESEENKPLSENTESPNVLSIQTGTNTVSFSSEEMSSRLMDLDETKANVIKTKLQDVDIVVAKGIKINVPRISNGAGKCGDIENAIVENMAKFIPINNGEIFIYISAIKNMYALTDKIVEGENGGIVLPNVIYSIPRPLLIKLFIADKMPDSIKGITNISLKPVRELAARTKTADTLNEIYNRDTVISSFKRQLTELRKYYFPLP